MSEGKKKTKIVLFVAGTVFSDHSFFYQSIECFLEMYDEVLIYSEPNWDTPLPSFVASAINQVAERSDYPVGPLRYPASEANNRAVRIIRNIFKNAWYYARCNFAKISRTKKQRGFIAISEKYGLNHLEKAKVWSLINQKPDMFWALNIQQLELALDIAEVTKCPVVAELVDIHTYGDEEARLAQRKLLVRADQVIFSSITFGEYFEHQNKTDPISFYHRPLVPSAIASEISPVEKEKNLIFFGNISASRNIDKILVGLSQTSHLHLTLMGRFLVPEYRSEIEKLIVSLELSSKVNIETPCSPDSIVSQCREFDVGIVYFDSNYDDSHKNAHPTKIGTYLASGLALLTVKNSSICQFLKDLSEVMYFNDDSQEEIFQKLQLLDGLSAAGLEECKRASLQFAKHYNWNLIGKESYCSQFMARREND